MKPALLLTALLPLLSLSAQAEPISNKDQAVAREVASLCVAPLALSFSASEVSCWLISKYYFRAID